MNPENALISRRVIPIDQGRVVIDEKWDLKHPGCPFVRPPWDMQSGDVYWRQTVITKEDYAGPAPAQGEEK